MGFEFMFNSDAKNNMATCNSPVLIWNLTWDYRTLHAMLNVGWFIALFIQKSKLLGIILQSIQSDATVTFMVVLSPLTYSENTTLQG